MNQNRDYYKYTEYDKEPGGLRKLDYIVDLIKSKFGDRKISILDYGCGRGNISLPLASLGYFVNGLDLDSKTIDFVNTNNKFENAVFEVKDYVDISEEDMYDVVIATEVIEHLNNPLTFLNIIRNRMRRDGVLIISVPNGYRLEELIRRFTTHTKIGLAIKTFIKKRILKSEQHVQTEANSPHIQFFSLSDIKEKLTMGGFEITEVKNSSAIFKEAYYLLLRLFVKRDSKLFRALDKLDNIKANIIPKAIGDGWIISATIKNK